MRLKITKREIKERLEAVKDEAITRLGIYGLPMISPIVNALANRNVYKEQSLLKNIHKQKRRKTSEDYYIYFWFFR